MINSRSFSVVILAYIKALSQLEIIGAKSSML